MKRFLLIGIVSATGLALLLVYLLFNGYIRFNYPDRNEFPIIGIDISHHQGEIRWGELHTENISFVMVKATEGGDFKDPLFNINWKESKAAGYKTGAYHFYRICKDGKEQAKNFLETVPVEPDNLPPTIDLEFGGNCKTDKTQEQIIEEINEFLSILEGHYKKRPIIYATHEFYDQFLIGKFTDHPIWIRDIFKRPTLRDGRDWLIWQFANRGHVNGIDGYVDLNVINGQSMELLK
ncbi:MAG: glycoside hydrolase family 25 protein [Cyclobacteriaceae bacterium]|nr:glycoside hydrolase family 25 protein [Cyclobacteriaceae bacterium]